MNLGLLTSLTRCTAAAVIALAFAAPAVALAEEAAPAAPNAEQHEAAGHHEEEKGEPPYGPDNGELFSWINVLSPATQDSLRRQIEAIHNSTSWRLTAPVRSVRRVLG